MTSIPADALGRSDSEPLPGAQQPPELMSWSGLFSCAQDNMAALRTHREYTASPLYRAKVDNLVRCIDEAIARLTALRCLPSAGEPSFTLLARDPQAPARVRDWVAQRSLAQDASLNASSKIQDAMQIARDMEAWKREHPTLGLPDTTVVSGALAGTPGLPSYSGRI